MEYSVWSSELGARGNSNRDGERTDPGKTDANKEWSSVGKEG